MSKSEILDTGDPHQNLANAIITQAAKDWRSAVKYIKAHPEKKGTKPYWNHEKTKKDCESFFLGDTFEILTDLDGEYLLRRLKDEAGVE